MASKSGFKVIIAGGGIAGLTLAIMLDRFDIDYVLLEAHGEIAPAVGASIGIFPNGMRLYDQLGCLEDIEKVATQKLVLINNRNAEGKSISKIQNTYGKLTKR